MKVLELIAIVLLAGCPWIAAIVYYGRKVRGDGWMPPSLGERLRSRMNVR